MILFIIWHPPPVSSCGEVFLLEIWNCFLIFAVRGGKNRERSKRKPLRTRCENEELGVQLPHTAVMQTNWGGGGEGSV